MRKHKKNAKSSLHWTGVHECMLFFRKDLNVWKGPCLPQWLKRKAQTGQTRPTRCIPGKCLPCTLERQCCSELGSPRRNGENSFQRGATGGWIMSRRQKKKATHWKDTCETQLGMLLFFGFFGDFGSSKFWNPVLDGRFEKEEIYQHEAHCDGPQR